MPVNVIRHGQLAGISTGDKISLLIPIFAEAGTLAVTI